MSTPLGRLVDQTPGPSASASGSEAAGPDLSVVIVNWNSAAYTLGAIESVHATARDLDHEILVVDNASTDDSRETLARPLPRTTVIHSPVNLGFARANNLAARRARGRTLLFLNPDTRVVPGALQHLLAALDAAPDVGAVGARLLNGDGSVQTSCVRPFPTIVNQALDAEWLRARLPALPLWGTKALWVPPQAGPVDVDTVSGACLMLSRELFERVGGFSEEYFLYAEDTDLCHKTWQVGFRVCHVPAARVVHYGGGSSGQQETDGTATVVMRESVHRFLRKTRGPAYAALFRHTTQAAAVARILLLGAAVLLPRERGATRASMRKWRRILRWARGGEPWAERLGAPQATSGATSR